MPMPSAEELYFPEHEEMPEGKLHLLLRTLLFQFLERAFSKTAAIGCDQFVYWDPTSPRVCLAPDAFVKLGRPDDLFPSWKAWERGAPEFAIEVVSGFDQRDGIWSEKLVKYGELGVTELLRFDPDGPEFLRAWDRIDGKMVERQFIGATRSTVLPGFWVTALHPTLGPAPRLSLDAAGTQLYLTAAEAAEARIAELEVKLAERG